MEKAPLNWPVVIMFTISTVLALVVVPIYAYYNDFDAFEWIMLALFFGFNGMSITAGYHRLWSHKSYQAHWILRFFYALGGALALQNSILVWCTGHRRHHQHVDDNDRDPYSANRGLWFSHLGWMIRNHKSGEEDFSNVSDLQKDPIVVWQHKYYLPLVLLMNIGVPLLIGYWHGDPWGTFMMAGAVRLFLSHHTTFFINSLAHYWGHQPYTDQNTARDNTWLALVTFGEGYHNYHHLFQWDYRNGIRWWHFDPTKWLIKSCSYIKLTSNLKCCSRFEIEKAQLTMQLKRAQSHLAKENLGSQWQERLEREYQQLLDTLKEWLALKADLKAIKHNLAERLRYEEVQALLKLQRKRWHILTTQFA